MKKGYHHAVVMGEICIQENWYEEYEIKKVFKFSPFEGVFFLGILFEKDRPYVEDGHFFPMKSEEACDIEIQKINEDLEKLRAR